MRISNAALMLGLIALAIGNQTRAIEPIDAQGPSARSVSSITSVPQPRRQESSMPQGQMHVEQPRRLMPSARRASQAKDTRPAAKRGADLLSSWAESSTVTALAALAFVVGLFMLLAWAVKRRLPRSSQLLPSDAVRILGRVALGTRQFGHLLQLGNKLILVSVSQTGVEKLAEIDDPQEVVRLVGLCGKTSSGGSQKEFDQVFGQFAQEKATTGFLGSEAAMFSSTKDASDVGGRRYA